MSVNILEALQNAEYNLMGNVPYQYHFQKKMGLDQLHNAIVLLEKGYDLYDKVDNLIEKYHDVENVPDKEELKK